MHHGKVSYLCIVEGNDDPLEPAVAVDDDLVEDQGRLARHSLWHVIFPQRALLPEEMLRAR